MLVLLRLLPLLAAVVGRVWAVPLPLSLLLLLLLLLVVVAAAVALLQVLLVPPSLLLALALVAAAVGRVLAAPLLFERLTPQRTGTGRRESKRRGRQHV
jgi:hypothetical protein